MATRNQSLQSPFQPSPSQARSSALLTLRTPHHPRRTPLHPSLVRLCRYVFSLDSSNFILGVMQSPRRSSALPALHRTPTSLPTRLHNKLVCSIFLYSLLTLLKLIAVLVLGDDAAAPARQHPKPKKTSKSTTYVPATDSQSAAGVIRII